MASYHFRVKTGKPGTAAEHSGYIAREGKHGSGGKRADLIATEHGNLPEWAIGNTHNFWQFADQTERSNGAAYREFEVALPTELTAEQNLELVKDFVRQELPGKTYQFAIHEPMAALGGTPQPHFHLMFSDRLPDGLERGPDQHFRRFNPAFPERGGCKKDSGGKDRLTLKDELVTTRERWASLHNEHLERHGHTAKIDSRSNLDRGIKDERERHFGHVAIKVMTEEEKLALKAKRQKGRQAASS